MSVKTYKKVTPSGKTWFVSKADNINVYALGHSESESLDKLVECLSTVFIESLPPKKEN